MRRGEREREGEGRKGMRGRVGREGEGEGREGGKGGREREGKEGKGEGGRGEGAVIGTIANKDRM